MNRVFLPQTHDHSICIRPPLPPFNVTSQNATFQLKGSFVSPNELLLCLMKLTERCWCLYSLLPFFLQGLHQRAAGVEVAL